MSGFRLQGPNVVATSGPELDTDQRRVVDHESGPLLVLAGPGTGKTTTLIESVVARIRRAESLETARTAPAVPLVLTFSRRAAADLRLRISRRLGRSTLTPRAMTFHAFCFALLRRFTEPETEGPGIRLLTAPEQEFRVRETLAGLRADDVAGWPDSVRRALPTRAFSGEVRAVLAKTRQLGLDPEDLEALGTTEGRPEWSAAGRYMSEYLDVLDFEAVLDYPELVHRCRILLTDPAVLNLLRAEIDGIYLDEFQDTDPAQARLVAELAGQGATVVAFGDPDQSIYSFRGAEARGMLDFPERFPTRNGDPAPIVALGTNYRFGGRLSIATRRIAERLPLSRSLPAEVIEAFRRPGSLAGQRARAEVYTFESVGAEGEHIADLLREAHLHQGLPWSEMAVLVRSGRRNLPALARALTAAGVPVEVAGDEIALSAELAVRPLLLALEVALADAPDADQAARLLLSPLGGLDSLGLRRLGRRLRDAERAELAGTALPEESGELVRRALADPAWLEECREAMPDHQPEMAAAKALADLIERSRARIADHASAEEVLWELWDGTPWPTRLRAESQRGGDTGRRADRDLDALCALFDIANRSEELVGARGTRAFLAEVEAQQIPADTYREGDLRGRGVRLMTAHRAKGLQWRLVVVAAVSEGVWPDLRLRGSLLDADRLGDTGAGPGLTDPAPVSTRLAEERRLFYVACTRAMERLVVTAVEGTEGEGDQPSRFINELGVVPVARTGRPRRPLNLHGLVGELRRISVDPEASPTLRDAAAVRLARLADSTDDDGRPITVGADPVRWWGMREVTDAAMPVLPPDQPVRITGSTLGGLLACPRQWFLSRRAAGDPGRHSAAGTGDVIHALVHRAAEDNVDISELVDHLDLVWDRLGFDAAYLSAVERVEAETMLERYAAWCAANDHRALVGTEVPFRVRIEVGHDVVELQGSVDRLERTTDGRLHIVDFKTGRSSVDKRELPTHEQLGVYQLAVTAGGFAEAAPGATRVGGAELVYLRIQDSGDAPYPLVLPQASLTESPHVLTDPEEVRAGHPTWVHARLAEAVAIIRSENFEARVGPSCRWCAFAGSCPARSAEVIS